MLERLTTNTSVRAEVLRQLVRDAIRHTNYARALTFAADLVKGTNLFVSDRLIQLDAMRAGRSPQFQPTLAELQQQVATNPPRAFELGQWMFRVTGPFETLGWLQTIPGNVRTNLPVTMVMADCYLASSNWTALQAHVSAQRWGELDYLRATFSARALREQHLMTASKADWSKSIKATDAALVGTRGQAQVWAGAAFAQTRFDAVEVLELPQQQRNPSRTLLVTNRHPGRRTDGARRRAPEAAYRRRPRDGRRDSICWNGPANRVQSSRSTR